MITIDLSTLALAALFYCGVVFVIAMRSLCNQPLSRFDLEIIEKHKSKES